MCDSEGLNYCKATNYCLMLTVMGECVKVTSNEQQACDLPHTKK